MLQAGGLLLAFNLPRLIDQIHHGPGPEGGDGLARPQAPFGLALDLTLLVGACHQRLPPSAPRSSQRWTESSTSRIEVGAAKRASSVLGAGRLSSTTMKRR